MEENNTNKFNLVRTTFPQQFASDGGSNTLYKLASILKITNIKTAVVEIKREQCCLYFSNYPCPVVSFAIHCFSKRLKSSGLPFPLLCLSKVNVFIMDNPLELLV